MDQLREAAERANWIDEQEHLSPVARMSLHAVAMVEAYSKHTPAMNDLQVDWPMLVAEMRD